MALLMQPILLGVGEILLKKMGKLPEEPVSFAQGVALALFAGTIMLCSGQSFSFIFELSA